MILAKDTRYVYVNKDGDERNVSDFILKPVYEIRDYEGFKSYMVLITKGTKDDGPYFFTSRDWSSERAFREWIGKCGARYSFFGGNRELYRMIEFAFQKVKPKPIKIIDGYGNVEERIWLFDNGAIYNGKIIKADRTGISWIKDYDVEGIRTSTHGKQRQLNIPKEYFTVEEVIKNIVRFYRESMMTWPMIGYATATIFFKPITGVFGCFPPMLCKGLKDSGKTRYAHIITSMCGAGALEVPSADSTVKGLRRYISQNCSFPIVINDFQGASREKLVNSFFDLDPYIMGEGTIGTETRIVGFNSSGILTAIKPPKREDVQSRLITIDFNAFKRDLTLNTDFLTFYHEGVLRGKNFGFLLEIIKTGMEDEISDLIKRTMNAFIKKFPDLDARQQVVLGILAGSFLAACDALDLYSLFEEFGAEVPDEISILKVFQDLATVSTKLMKESKEMRVFFEILENLYARGKTENYARVDYDHLDGEQDWFVEFHLKTAHNAIMKEDKSTGQQLYNVSRNYVSQHLKSDFNVKGESTSFSGKHWRMHKVRLNDLRDKYGLYFETGMDDGREEEEEDGIFPEQENGKVPF